MPHARNFDGMNQPGSPGRDALKLLARQIRAQFAAQPQRRAAKLID
jgi:hypothetical protein